MSRLTSEPFRRKLDDSSENYKVRRYGREEWETLAQNAINKLGRLEDIEEELGCPLEVVFKAMTMGILVKNHEDLIEIGYSDRRDKYVYFSTEEIYLKNWQSHGIEKTTNRFQITYGDDGEWCVYLEDYQKTWWMKGEK